GVAKLEPVAGAHNPADPQGESLKEIDHLCAIALSFETPDQLPPCPVVPPAHAGRDDQHPGLRHGGETTVPGDMVVASALGAALVVTGLSLFLVGANPDRGRADASTLSWLLRGLTTAVPVALCIWAAGRSPGVRRAAFLATAAGIVCGVTAAITKATAHLL